MANPDVRIGHLRITDHLILGTSAARVASGQDSLGSCGLEPVAKTGWNEIADALAKGDLDAAFVLAPTAMDLYKAGVPIRLILFTHKTGSVFIRNNKAGIDKIEDLAGKVVLIPYQLSVHNMLLHRLLAEHGLKAGPGGTAGADVILEVMAPAMMPQALEFDEEGEIGGFIVAEPFGSQVVEAGYGDVLHLSKDLWPDHPCCVFVVREETIGKHPEAVAEITASLVRSGNFIEDSPAEAARLGADFLAQDAGLIQRVLTDPPDRIKTGELFPVIADLAAIQDYMFEQMGIMKSKVDLEKFVDVSFAKQAGAK